MRIARRFNGGKAHKLTNRVPAGGRMSPLQYLAMSHVYTSILIHFVFSTKDRRPLIPEDLQPKLWAYMGGIARANKFKALAIGGIEDHAHALLSLPASMPPAKGDSVGERWLL